MTAKPNLTVRTFRSALVGLCNGCGLYTEPYEGDCPGMCEREWNWQSADNLYRRQVKRRVLVCSVCRMGAANEQEFKEHNCNDYDH